MRKNLLAWQWSDYRVNHRNRTNLIIHIFAVPLFDASIIGLVVALVSFSPATVAIAVGGILVSLIAQGRGHKLEKKSPTSFNGAADFLTRFFAEQWVTFPRFVLSGEWYRNFIRANQDLSVCDGKANG